jgi:hypothetical protein
VVCCYGNLLVSVVGCVIVCVWCVVCYGNVLVRVAGCVIVCVWGGGCVCVWCCMCVRGVVRWSGFNLYIKHQYN